MDPINSGCVRITIIALEVNMAESGIQRPRLSDCGIQDPRSKLRGPGGG